MKRIKDPIYGYIEIEDEFIPLIDSANFSGCEIPVRRAMLLCFPVFCTIALCIRLVFFSWEKSFRELQMKPFLSVWGIDRRRMGAI